MCRWNTFTGGIRNLRLRDRTMVCPARAVAGRLDAPVACGDHRTLHTAGLVPREWSRGVAGRQLTRSCTGPQPLLYCVPRSCVHPVAVRAGELQIRWAAYSIRVGDGET